MPNTPPTAPRRVAPVPSSPPRRRASLVETLERRSLLADDHILIDHGPVAGRGHGEGDYQPISWWGSTATNGSIPMPGRSLTLTWGLVNDGLSIPGSNGEPTSPSNLKATLNAQIGPESVWLPLFQSVFDDWSSKTGITYVYQPTDDGAPFAAAAGTLGARADIRISGHALDGPRKVLAYNFYAGNGGDMVIDTAEFSGTGAMRSSANNYRAFRNVVAHEHGHGLGLAHVDPVNQTKLMEPFLSTDFELAQFDDILGAQSSYGDPLEKNGGNDTPATATNVGALPLAAGATLATDVSIADTGESDYFKFTIPETRFVTLAAAPTGPSYPEAPQGGSPTTFSAALQGDLRLTLYAANGTTILRDVDTNSFAMAESISDLSLLAGTYFVRVSMTDGMTQMYRLSASSSIAAVPPAVPGKPNLVAGSDTGLADNDDITKRTTPTFTGTAEPLSMVTLVVDGANVATVLSSAAGSYSFTLSEPLADGVHTFAAFTSNSWGNSATSASLQVTIDTVAPALAQLVFDRDVTQDFIFTFAGAAPVTLDPADLTLTNRTTGTTYGSSSFYVFPSETIATAGFALAIPDGRFELRIADGAVTDRAGNVLPPQAVFSFNHLTGDADNDADVDFRDLVTLAQNYNAGGRTFSQGNFDYSADGRVDFQDLVLLAQKYNTSLPPLPASMMASGASALGAKSTTAKRKPIAPALIS